jgi:hypothetical protein
MKYLLTIYGDERVWSEASPEFIETNMAAYGELGTAMRDAGVHLGGEGLQPSSTATSVTVRDGETLVTDGPFAETREQLGGYYLLDCKDLDEAIGWAARIPDARHGTVEVRPVMDYEAMGMPEAHVASEGAGS